jgi:hypothetical protein
MDVMGFTSADLDANRQGNLSQFQADNLKRTRQRNTIIGAGLFFVIVIVATFFIFFGQQNENPILSAMGGLLTVVNAIMVGMVGRSYLRTNADLRDGNVEVLEGELERIVRPGRQQDNYLLRIDGTSITVTKEIFIQFRHETPYRIYRTRLSGMLLSAEPLTE